ncbi:protein-tyrosine sulfotransferase isoform X2 [Sesamum indicum]|uniref:Sulfotransferase n=1 Tax=Sesamum indicum TaxID=4182 RepID=A0A6I9TZ25_SESIN|nr:protein-tyrosine sulfotransferase isoform X2 [Sesamum indicum]
MCKIMHLMLGLILVLLLSVPVIIKASEADDGYSQCQNIVKNWASSSLDSEVKDDKHDLRDLLFFLHVPRTGGRTYFHCFLKKLYSNSQECPRSYDKLRVNPRKPNCRLLSTHDDYSMMSKLPKEKTSVVTILRNPIDRVFSTYEFSVEVAARFLIHPNLTSVARMARMAQRRRKTSGVSTLDIWPWKYLVPWMREDLFARRDARKLRGQLHLVANSSYDVEDILMPLREYIHHPIALDIVHNGATFQIAGLTNNSYFAEAHEVRHCVLKYHTLGEYVLEVAKKRLADMLYVGLTENHRESATMFANIVGAQVISQHTISSSSAKVATNDHSEQSSITNTISDANDQGNSTYQTLEDVSSTGKYEIARDNLTVGKLMEAYESCISSLRNSQSERRVNSLKRISPVNFTKEARRQIPEVVIQEIASLNSLDIELYNYAQHIFNEQQGHMTQRMVYAVVGFSTSESHTSSNYCQYKFMNRAFALGLPSSMH